MKPGVAVLRRRTLRVVLRLVRWKSLDIKSVTARLQAIGGPRSEASGFFAPADHDRANRRLWAMVVDLVPLLQTASLDLLDARGAPKYVHWFPGDHYRLLAALVRLLRPALVLELGTFRGHGVLAMLPELPEGGRIVTFDIIPWESVPDCLLRAEDLSDGRVTQILADLGNEQDAQRYANLICSADLIMVDAAKDGVFERRILAGFERLGLKDGAVVVFDDIRHWNMLDIWREIDRPKLDVTSLGHYSGTGIVDWTGPREA
jgi:predicted O-methyltransferase YrrM